MSNGANLSTWTDPGNAPGIIVAVARILPKSESVQTLVWARIGFVQLRQVARKRGRASCRFISPPEALGAAYHEKTAPRHGSGRVTGNSEVTKAICRDS